jgi:hypothetical protein
VLYLNHNACLNQVPVDRVAHPRPPGLYFEAALPILMVGVNLVENGGNTVFAIENWPLYFLAAPLTRLYLETQALEVNPQHTQYFIAC